MAEVHKKCADNRIKFFQATSNEVAILRYIKNLRERGSG